MSINFPENRREISDRIATDVQTTLPESNPFLKNSFLQSFIFGLAGRVFDVYENLQILIREIFPDTATEEFLERWGELKGVTRNPSTRARGFINVVGALGATIPAGVFFQGSQGRRYENLSTVAVGQAAILISNATFDGSLVTIETTTNHGFSTGLTVLISGFTEIEYNGAVTITVNGLDSFTYNPAVDPPSSPATGTGVAEATFAACDIQSVDFGQETNLNSGEIVTLASPIANVESDGTVTFSEVSGGTDDEDDTDLRERVLDVYQNPPTPYNTDAIRQKAREVAGVTRVFVDEATTIIFDQVTPVSITQSGFIATIDFGQPHFLENSFAVTVSGANEPEFNREVIRGIKIDDNRFAYPVLLDTNPAATGVITVTTFVPAGVNRVFFTRDNDENIIPSSQEANDVKALLVQDLLPAHTDPRDLIVNPPTPVVVNFTFTSLEPNTATMQQAIAANLQAYFRDETEVGVDLKSFEYESIIFQTVDSEKEIQAVRNFTLSDPVGDVTINQGEIPILGTIVFP